MAGCRSCNLKPQVEGGKGLKGARGQVGAGCRSCNLKPQVEGGEGFEGGKGEGCGWLSKL